MEPSQRFVKGYIFEIFPVEFDLKENDVRVMTEHWLYRWFGWTLYFFKDSKGNILTQSVTIYHPDPAVYQDCVRILKWNGEEK